MRGLANARFEVMTFKAGVGSYMLDFSGELRRDGEVNIESGLSTVTIIVPADSSARLHLENGCISVWG